MYDQTGST